MKEHFDYLSINHDINQPNDRSLNAEIAVLGACLVEADTCRRYLQHMQPEYFFLECHQNIVKAMRAMVLDGEAIDIITVSHRLKLMNLYEDGIAYHVTYLCSKVNSSANVEHHLRQLFDLYVIRRAKRCFMKGIDEMEKLMSDPLDILSDVLTEVTEMVNLSPLMSHNKTLSEVLNLSLDELDRRMQQQQDGLTGITTGITVLDTVTGGWQPGMQYILAGRTSMGKTAVALHFARMAANAGKKVLAFSMEMTPARLGDRLLLGENDTPVDSGEYARGLITAEQADALRTTAGRMISRMELRVNDNSMLTAMQACSVARHLHSQGLCDIILMDYLQLLRPEGLRKETREQEVANCSRLMKALAKDLNIPVLLLSQLNREVETRRDQEPKLSDLRESGAIEQDADMVILLFRPAAAGLPNDTVTKIPSENLMVMNVAKNRNGMTQRFVCTHSDDMTKFTDYRNDTLSQLGTIPPPTTPPPVSIHDSYTLFRDGE